MLPVAVVAVVLTFAPLAFGISPTKHPSYCPLPEDVTFDKTQHPELIGLYTGKWVPDDSMRVFYVRRFCVLLTSISGDKVRGIYSWDSGGRDGKSGWREIESVNSKPSAIRFRYLLGETSATLTLEFPGKGKPTATYTSPGRHYFWLQSRLAKIE